MPDALVAVEPVVALGDVATPVLAADRFGAVTLNRKALAAVGGVRPAARVEVVADARQQLAYPIECGRAIDLLIADLRIQRVELGAWIRRGRVQQPDDRRCGEAAQTNDAIVLRTMACV